MWKRLLTTQQSLRAPGLPTLQESHDQNKLLSPGNPRLLDVLSINYDFLFANLDSPKVLWLDLRKPAPKDLLVGTSVRLHITPNKGIQTTLNKVNPYNSVFYVDDIVGSRVVLSPYKGSAWLPTNHMDCTNPFGWGYSTEWSNARTSHHGSKYGYGTNTAFLEYYPMEYSNRAGRLESMKIEEDYYRGSQHIPGWRYS